MHDQRSAAGVAPENYTKQANTIQEQDKKLRDSDSQWSLMLYRTVGYCWISLGISEGKVAHIFMEWTWKEGTWNGHSPSS